MRQKQDFVCRPPQICNLHSKIVRNSGTNLRLNLILIHRALFYDLNVFEFLMFG